MAHLTLGRTLHLTTPLQHGTDVLAAQTLLTARGFPMVLDGIFGPESAGQCVTAKRKLGYAKAKQTPTCGQALIDNLEAHRPFPPPKPVPLRVKYVLAWIDAIAHHARWDYEQSRPIPHPPVVGKIVTDCSGAVTYLAELSGCPDPNGKIGGKEFSGLGYTGTLAAHCTAITRPMLLPGDLVLFGIFPYHHVCAVLNNDADPELGSHGRQGDPRAVRLSYEVANQPPGVSYVRWLPI